VRRAVLFFESHSGHFDGAQQSLFLLISALDKRRYYPIFLGPVEGELPCRLRAARIETIILPPPASEIASYGGAILQARPWSKARLLIPYMRYVLGVARILREKDIDIVHCNSIRSLLMVAPAARLGRIPLIWHLRLNLELGLWNRVGRRLADRIIVVSDNLRRDFPGGPGAAHKFVVVPNGVDPAVFAPGIDRFQASSELGINPGWSVVGMAGSITERKGQLLLLQAAAKVVKVFPRVKFVLIGRTNDARDEEYAAKLRGYVEHTGLTENVRFVGWCSNMPRVLNALDLFVLPSLNEGLPRSILEAMAAAVPVVATNVGGNAELVDAERTGLLVPPRDPDALAAAIARLLGVPETAREMGRAGRLMVKQHFSIGAAALGVERVFDQLLPADGSQGMAA
jgi:glycosyltransferase involved in cell wall biosynthesis